MGIVIFGSVLMLYSKVNKFYSRPLKMQITKVGAFFSETV